MNTSTRFPSLPLLKLFSGFVTREAPFDHITPESLAAVLPSFTGDILQTPPIFSALHKDGRRLYDLARNENVTAEDIDLQARPVTITSIALTKVELPHFDMSVRVGGGTYIRSLCRDIGEALDSAATMVKLVRTQQG